MNCPECHKKMYVVCSNLSCVCHTYVPDGELPMITFHEEDAEQCPYCGFTAHIDFWEELDMDSNTYQAARVNDEKETP